VSRCKKISWGEGHSVCWWGHRWVYYSCRPLGPKSVHSGNEQPLLASQCHCQSVCHFKL